MSKSSAANYICFAFTILSVLSAQIFACEGKVPENMVLIPADDFAYRGDENNPPVESFYIDKYEVTNRFYCQFLNEADPYGLHYTSEMEIACEGDVGDYSYAVKQGKENYPVQYVSALDAEAFAAWRSLKYGGTYRLPTEQEWEKAAGWDPEKKKLWKYPFQSDTIDMTRCNYGMKYKQGKPKPVGFYNGVNEGTMDSVTYYGCYDMCGNLLEWTSSMYDTSSQVIRGGYWHYPAHYCTVTFRMFNNPSIRLASNGFRLCRSLDSSGTSEEASLKVDSAALEHWQDLRFGMMITFGLSSLTGHELSWSRGRETPIEEYDQLYKKLNPELFDAKEWVKAAKSAGMKYIILITKHHDGFCLWPSEYTDYDIASTPFKRDIVGELSKACRDLDIEFGTYYSVCDWIHPDYPQQGVRGSVDNPNSNTARYAQYLQNQTRELLENYGPLLTMWFDVPRVFSSEYGIPAIQLLRKLQPDILVSDRAYVGEPRPVGDYDTPEQEVGDFNRARPWETCMTICKQWSWKPDDNMKSLKECIQTLLYTIGGDGNLLFGVGPMPDGRIEPRQVDRLKEMGEWIEKYQDGIYGTRGGPFIPGKWGAATCKEDKIYLFIMDWQDKESLDLPPIPVKIKCSKALSGGEVNIIQKDDRISVAVPAESHHDIATVIELTVDGKAIDIEPVSIDDELQKD